MKLLVSDLDGTLYKHRDNYSYGINEENQHAVLQWISAGNLFAVATARGLDVYDSICQKIGKKISFIGCNGSHIVYEEGKLEQNWISMNYLVELTIFIDKNNYDATVKTCPEEDWIYTGNQRYPFNQTQRRRPAHAEVTSLEKIDPEMKTDKISITVHPDQRKELQKVLTEIYENKCTVTSSDIDKIDIGPLGCTKGKGIIKLANYYQLSKKDILVIGDSENDISMMQEAGCSYCMSHSDELVKHTADYVVDSVAEAIKNELKKNGGKNL